MVPAKTRAPLRAISPDGEPGRLLHHLFPVIPASKETAMPWIRSQDPPPSQGEPQQVRDAYDALQEATQAAAEAQAEAQL